MITRETTRDPRRILILVCVAQFMLLVDDTIVNLALPAIGDELEFSGSGLSWVTNAYFLTFGGFLLLGGRLADAIGRRRLFAISLSAFVLASLACGLALNGETLVIARGIQGTAGAMLSPSALAILLATYKEPAARARALGVWAALTGLGAATGLLLGGALVEWTDWRWIFLINLPVGVAALLLLPRVVAPDVRREKKSPTDVIGALTATAGLLLLVYTVVETESHGWSSPRTLWSFAAVAVLLGAFAVRQRVVTDPLIPRQLLRIRSVVYADMLTLVAASGLFAMFFFLTLYMQEIQGWSAVRAGISYLPFTAAMAMGSAVGAKVLSTRLGRVPLMVGPLVGALGLFLMSRLDATSSYVGSLMPALVVLGVGLGMTFVPLMHAATGGAGEGEGGLSSALMTTSQQVGAAISIAALVTVAMGRTEDLVMAGSPLATATVEGFARAFEIQAGLLALAAVLGALVAKALQCEAKRGRPRAQSEAQKVGAAA